MIRLGTWAALGLAGLALGASTQEDPPEPRPPETFLEGEARERFLDRVEARMEERASVCATFVQEKHLAVFDEPLVAHGVILFQRPDRIRWEIREPFRSLLVVRAEEVAKFEFVGGTRRALELGRGEAPLLAVMKRIRGWFLGSFDRGERTYGLRVASEPDPWIVLVPKDPGVGEHLEAIEVLLAPELDGVRRVVVRERGGDRTVMRFEERRRDLELDPAYFSPRDPRELVLEELAPEPEPERVPGR